MASNTGPELEPRTHRPAGATRSGVLSAAVVLLALTAAARGASPAAGNAAPPAPAGDRPNIVFILADDLGINDLGCYGRKDQPTPNLDRLAAEGMRFTTAYAAQCLCSPTRAALMTGKSPARVHITTYLPGRPDASSHLLLPPRINQALPAGEVTIAGRLKDAGYATALLGKWHLGGKGSLPTDFGFDSYLPVGGKTVPSATEGFKGEMQITAAAEKFLDDNKDRPFFLYVAHNNPHIPLGAKPGLADKHKAAWHPVYAAMIETLDESVGRIVAKVDALGLGGRTLIVFTSDNGGLHVPEGGEPPATYNAPWRAGKGYVHEGGHRVPQIVRWTGRVKAGTTSDVPVITTDWTPTMLDLVGVKTADKFDGVSLAGLLTGGAAPAARPLFWHFPHYSNQGGRPAGAVREGDWKLIEHYEDGRCELFHLGRDPGESKDVSADEPARVASLRGKLEAWRREVGAQGFTANPGFDLNHWKAAYTVADSTTATALSTAEETKAKWLPWRKAHDAGLPGRAPGGPAGKAGKAAKAAKTDDAGKVEKSDVPASPVPGARGAVILHAREAKVTGTKLRYEEPAAKDTLGFWVDKNDKAAWTFAAPGPRKYEVQLLVGCGKGSGGAEVEVDIGGKVLTFTVAETGHFQRFVPVDIGQVVVDAAGPVAVEVRAKTKPKAAVMDLRRITLRAVPEEAPPAAAPAK